jgi:hypothetical protein
MEWMRIIIKGLSLGPDENAKKINPSATAWVN